jgi:3-oxoadipate enol-lactonase
MDKRQAINGFEMYVEDAGSGPALLFVHGYPLDHTMWAYQLEAFQGDYRVIAPDMRGHGQSAATAGAYAMDLLADDLRALLDTLNVERVALAGLSMGGYVAFAFWRRYPQRVRALILADTRASADTPAARQGRYATVERVRAEGTASVVDGMLPKLLAPATLENKPDILAHARRMMSGAAAEGVIGALLGMAERPDSTPTLATITAPALVVVGEHDAITPPTDADAMHTAIPGARLVVIPAAGHLAPLENPTAFNQALREFLSGTQMSADRR